MSEDRVWLTNEKGVLILKLTQHHLKDALAMMRDSYYTDEPVSKGLRLQECPGAIDDLEQLTIETFEDGSSLVALYDGKVVGASFNKVQTRSKPGEGTYFEHFRDFKCKTDTAKENMNVMIQIDAQINTFAHYQPSEQRGNRGHFSVT
ncbi:uncharacterized protein LOC135938407 [Cloeon dipterum]|uniref:uncharacterized protein LOC135938407 n=1 Tax=Cloeon dipterum TaxID=197152 RepID=UPI00321FD367